jgi:hypothetical protein
MPTDTPNTNVTNVTSASTTSTTGTATDTDNLQAPPASSAGAGAASVAGGRVSEHLRAEPEEAAELQVAPGAEPDSEHRVYLKGPSPNHNDPDKAHIDGLEFVVGGRSVVAPVGRTLAVTEAQYEALKGGELPDGYEWGEAPKAKKPK